MRIIELGKFLVLRIRLLAQRDVRSIQRQIEKERFISGLAEIDERFTVLSLKDHSIGDASGQAFPALMLHGLEDVRKMG